jgi:glycosyltransferase involved in cell wall biosynthesis
MAAYRGEKFIREQLASILEQLGAEDEVVVVDDCSPDGTAAIVEGVGDPRVRLLRHGANRGYVRAFETAMLASRGQYVFLSDQDDVWIPGRVEAMLAALDTHHFVASNFAMHGDASRPWIPRLDPGMDGRTVANLLGILVGYRAYYGCGMAFRREALRLVLPIPSYVRESHDLWLAICGSVDRSLAHLATDTLERRVHGENQTPAGFRSLPKILAARIMFVRLIAEAVRRRVRDARRGQA